MATDTAVNQLIINKLTKAQFAALTSVSNTELYEITDSAHYTEAEITALLATKMDTVTLATVATTGKYSDLTGVPTKVSEFTNDAGYLTEHQDISGKQDSLTTAQLAAANSGITAAKVTSYDDHIADTTVHITAAERTAWNAKQAALTTAQLAAANSGITADKVSTYDGYATTIAGKADAATTLAGYGITDAYTKTEVDAKVASVYRVKGSVATVAALPTSGNTTGDVYNVTATGMNYVWTGTEWDALGSIVDLSDYAKTADIDTKLEAKADKATTLAGYGITDAKIVSGVITLGTATITPLTADSTLDATKLSGTASIDTTGTSAKATADASGNVITTTYATKTEVAAKANSADLAAVATSGSYNDLSDTPTIPTVTFRVW